jgi:hypothetical protein
MIYLFHGDNQFDSRVAFNHQIDSYKNADLLKVDQKEISTELVNNFLQSISLLGGQRVLAVTNLFSVPKANLDKILKSINQSDFCDVLIWQDKKLTPTQINALPKSKVESFQLNNQIFNCLNAVKPKNLKNFIPLYEKVIKDNLYDLFLYLLKANIRKQLSSYSRFDQKVLKRIYLQLIELDFQNKSGQLAIQKEIALQRIIINLMR